MPVARGWADLCAAREIPAGRGVLATTRLLLRPAEHRVLARTGSSCEQSAQSPEHFGDGGGGGVGVAPAPPVSLLPLPHPDLKVKFKGAANFASGDKATPGVHIRLRTGTS